MDKSLYYGLVVLWSLWGWLHMVLVKDWLQHTHMVLCEGLVVRIG
jgi:hypothetical protein